MASTVVAAIPRTVPPMPISTIPRVRPPRFLPGQPRDDQLPQPEGEAPPGQIWTQGKWRRPNSMAVIDRHKVMSKQIKKAVERSYNGLNIYAYYHMSTRQVVYSLTRIMKSGQIMPQLINHGKKTVPNAIRRDIWRPYFSIHFPDNDGGRKAGLKAYQRLREFSLRRQLDPPQEELMTTQADLDRAVKRFGNPVKLRERYRNQSGKMGKGFQLPLLGQKLPQHLRAEKLMDQKASSVADASFVVGLALEQLQSLYKMKYRSDRAIFHRTQGQLQSLGKRGRKTLRIKRRHEEEKAAEVAQRQELAHTVDMDNGQLPLNKHVAAQLSMQLGGTVLGASNRVLDVKPIKNDYDTGCDIQILWTDIRDGTYAASWPQGVFHAELQPHALSLTAAKRISQRGYTAEDGVEVSTQWQHRVVSVQSSVHVHGDEKTPGFRRFQDDLAVKHESSREAVIRGTKNARHKEVKRRLVSFYEQYLETRDLALRVEELHKMQTLGEPLTEADVELAQSKDNVVASLEKLEEQRLTFEDELPNEAAEARELVEFRSLLSTLRAEKVQGTESELQLHAEQADPARFAAAKEMVEEYPVHEKGSSKRKAAELAAATRLVEQRRKAPSAAREVVMPDEKGLWGRIMSWIGR